MRKYQTDSGARWICPVVVLWLVLCAQACLGFYNPSQGRWLSRDPIQERGGRNVYAVASNDAVRGHDLLGLCSCEILSPLTVKLTPPREILGKDASIDGPADQSVWDGDLSRVWLTMKATFSSRCCKFQQRAKSHATVDGQQADNLEWDDDTDDNADFYTASGGAVQFSDWDNPGWEQNLINPQGGEFGGTKSFVGYVIDICNRNQHVGPSLYYGFIASGTGPNIQITTYGFSE